VVSFDHFLVSIVGKLSLVCPAAWGMSFDYGKYSNGIYNG